MTDLLDLVTAQVIVLGTTVDAVLDTEAETFTDLTDRATKLDHILVLLDAVREQLVAQR